MLEIELGRGPDEQMLISTEAWAFYLFQVGFGEMAIDNPLSEAMARQHLSIMIFSVAVIAPDVLESLA